MNSRIRIVFSCLGFLAGIVMVRAAWLQLFPNEQIRKSAERQFQTSVSLKARRGAIVDRHGRDLALSETAYSLFADPQVLKTPRRTARWLAHELGQASEALIAKFADPQKRFVWVARTLDSKTRDRIQSKKIRGLGWIEEARRIYPNENLMGPLLGFLGSEGQGLEGLELSYDQLLNSRQRKMDVRRDARGRPLIVDGQIFRESLEGLELQLTLDLDLQHQLEGELKQAVMEFQAEQAMGVILDARTSAILAMANTPGYNPNQGAQVPSEWRRNRSVTDLFEPGSTLKTFAIAAGLREGKLTPSKVYATEQGRFKVGDRIIREAEASHNWSELSVIDILALSSNIGTTKIAFEVGADKIRQSFSDFGFGSKSGVDLPGEVRGQLAHLPWNPVQLSNISFGQGISTSALQVANAYAAIANGGVLNQPFIVLAQKDVHTGRVEITKPQSICRVLSFQQSSQMRNMLVAVTGEKGTGKTARVEGFLVGGKTGTAQKPNPNSRGYLPDAYLSSFVGFVPAENPQYVIAIFVDHPKSRSYYGSQVAGPVFSRLASYALRKQGVSPLLSSAQ
ncbi:MAG: penicillin-binding protein 2 [Bdellovibrio sp.]